MRIDSGVEMTWLSIGAFLSQTESLVANEGLIFWPPMTTGKTAHGSEDEIFSSEELGSGVEVAGVESVWFITRSDGGYG